MRNLSVVKSERVVVIDSLRGIAALAVVLFHYIGFIPLMGIPVSKAGSMVVKVTRYGHLGVPVFFVLSGYVIAMTSARYSFDLATGSRFLLRRMVRLAPPYWAMIVLIVVTQSAGHAAGYFRNSLVTPGQVAAHLFYAQDLLGFPPLDIAYWTLCLEVQFYLVFSISAVAFHKCSHWGKAGWFFALTLASFMVNCFGVVPQAWCPLLWYQFGIGILTFYCVGHRPAQLALILLLCSLLAIRLYHNQPEDITLLLVVLLLLGSNRIFQNTTTLGCKILLHLGRISYSLYLVHGFIGIGLSLWFRSSGNRTETASWMAIGVSTIAALIFATLFYQFCELRAVEWSRAIRIGVSQSPSVERIGKT